MSRFVRLVRVELTRLRYRRAILLLLAAAVVVPLVIAVAVVFETRPPSEADRAAAEQEVAAISDDPFYARQLERCLSNPQRYGVPERLRADADDLGAACEERTQPRVEDYLYYSPLDLDEQREFSSGLGVTALMITLMFLVGTTFVGHDWATGSMSNQLLFETRRLRVWSAKALAVLAVAVGLTGVVLTAYWLGLYAVASGRDDVGVRPGALLDCLQHGWRAAGFAGAAAVGGYALTNLFRSTVFSLGALAGVSIAGGLLLATLGPDDPGGVDPTINAQAVISDGTTYYVDPPERCFQVSGGFDDDDPDCAGEKERTLGQGVTYYGILLGAVALASAGSFRRRDVP